jgi:hypothetical protein
MKDRLSRIIKRPKTKKKKPARPRQPASSKSKGSTFSRILQLQRTIGNHAVTKLIESGQLQKKLKIGKPNDRYEQEADSVADKVMRMPETKVQRQPMGEDKEEEPLQTKRTGDNTPKVTSSIESQINSLGGGGRALSQSERAFFEPRFGHDFNDVKVHTDSRAAELARDVNAKAFTVGHDVVFDTGQYSPETMQGKRLLAHELTHVTQQGAAPLLQRQTKEKVHPIVRAWETCHLHKSPNPSSDYWTYNDELIQFQKNQDLKMISSEGEWLKVEGEAFLPTGESVGISTGWINRSSTNLAPAKDAATENDRVAQDLDDFLDAQLLPALGKWEGALLVQGNAYLTAYTEYKDALLKATQEAKARADFYAAVLTAVSVGALGWFGDVASKGSDPRPFEAHWRTLYRQGLEKPSTSASKDGSQNTLAEKPIHNAISPQAYSRSPAYVKS